MLRPDSVDRPSARIREIINSKQIQEDDQTLRQLSPNAGISAVRMLITGVTIREVQDLGKNEINVFSVVTDDVSPEPFAVTVKTFENIPDGGELQIGGAGLTIYRNPQGAIPGFLDFRIMIVESDERMRSAAQFLQELRSSDEYGQALQLLKTTGGPTIGNIVAASDAVLGIAANIMRMNPDDQLMLVAGSYDALFDGLGTNHGPREALNDQVEVYYEVQSV